MIVILYSLIQSQHEQATIFQPKTCYFSHDSTRPHRSHDYFPDSSIIYRSIRYFTHDGMSDWGHLCVL